MEVETFRSQLFANILYARTVCGTPPTEYQITYHNIGDLLTQQAKTYGDKPWLIFYPDDHKERRTSPDSPADVRHSYSYGEFHELVCKTANFLLHQGITRGDRIATIAYNHSDTVVQYFAAWMIGAVVVPINVGEDDKRIGYILQNSQAKLAFVRGQFIERVERILNESPCETVIVIVGRDNQGRQAPIAHHTSHIDFRIDIEHQTSDINIPDSPSLEDEALIVYTSGTTGNPKGVVLTHYNLLIDAKVIAEWHGMTPGQTMMCVLPIHHVNGTIVTLMTPMYYGGTVVLNQKFHSGSFFKRIAEESVNVVSVVPTLLQFLLHEDLDLSKVDLSRLRHIICGAGPLTCELATKFEDRFHIRIIHGYGLSETTCYSSFLPLDLSHDEHQHWMRACGFPSIGVPIPSNEMTIHDDHGNELPEGSRGEIVIRGHNVMKCYYANPEVNESTFAHGWFRSGDEGFFRTDDKGRKFFFITGRIKELIIRGGINISPFEIDEVLMKMPGVKAGLVVGFENDWYGEEIGAYVHVRDDAVISEDDVIAYCRNSFAYQKCPKVVVFGNDIPVTSTGKYQRNKLKPLFTAWKTTQFSERTPK